MEFYIRTLSEHWAELGMLGAFYSWDVANEVIASSVGAFSGDWRNHIRTVNNPWLDAYSNNPTRIPGHPTDYIYDAFVFARRYFPYSVLYYNDYNEQQPGKREAIAQMVEYFNGRWAHDFDNNPEAVPRGQRYRGRLLIEGIGMQAHYHAMGGWTGWGPAHNPAASNVRLSIERFAQTGARVSITELDITLGGFGWQEIANPTDTQWQTQADFYARVFSYILEFSDYIPRVSIWGLADHHSWRRIGNPLLFDTNYQAKPAFHAIHQALANFERANGRPRVNAPNITTESLPNGSTRTRYSAQLTAERNNWAPILWTVEDGALPSGLRLHSRTGVIEGTPTRNGTFDFTIGIENAGGLTTQEFSITIGVQGN
jgi:endo-1,4-beta-xylanase